MNLKYTVKEMEHITGVSSRTLRYYDSIGLFSPTGVLPNGYRYYTIDKIEEIHFINYLRHVGVPIKEIKKHLSNRNIEAYESILQDQLFKVQQEITRMQNIEKRIHRRIHSLEYIRNLPPIGEIILQKLSSRKIIELKEPFRKQEDWEMILTNIENRHSLPPSMFIGDVGFFVDLSQVENRGPEEFTGLFLLADEPYYKTATNLTELPAGTWLTLYIRGDHTAASKEYARLLAYAEDQNLSLGNFALERTIIDHYISTDPDYYITEIQIPVIL